MQFELAPWFLRGNILLFYYMYIKGGGGGRGRGPLTHPSHLFVQTHPHGLVDLDIVHAEEGGEETKWKLR